MSNRSLMFDGLTKEGFWDRMEEKHPLAVKKFKQWIDEYKDIVGWRDLFQDQVKFHDIPYEMQMGIMNRFFIESFASREEYLKDGNLQKEYHKEMEYAVMELDAKLLLQN